jgi:hypothetical protein
MATSTAPAGDVDPEPALLAQLVVQVAGRLSLPIALPDVLPGDLLLAELPDGGSEQLLLRGEFVVHLGWVSSFG